MKHIYSGVAFFLILVLCNDVFSADGDGSLYNRKYESQVRDVQERMQSDPTLLQLIISLQNNPKFRETFQDPDILQAIIDGDTARLSSNPKIRRLLNDPTLLEIHKRLE